MRVQTFSCDTCSRAAKFAFDVDTHSWNEIKVRLMENGWRFDRVGKATCPDCAAVVISQATELVTRGDEAPKKKERKKGGKVKASSDGQA